MVVFVDVVVVDVGVVGYVFVEGFIFVVVVGGIGITVVGK